MGVDKPHAHGSPGEEDLGGGDVAALAEKGGQGLAEGSGALQPDHGHPFALVKQLLHLADGMDCCQSPQDKNVLAVTGQ